MIAIYERGASEDSATAIEIAIRVLSPIRAAGVMEVSRDGPVVHAEEALRLAGDALDAARTAGGDGVVRFATQRQSWAASPPPA